MWPIATHSHLFEVKLKWSALLNPNRYAQKLLLIYRLPEFTHIKVFQVRNMVEIQQTNILRKIDLSFAVNQLQRGQTTRHLLAILGIQLICADKLKLAAAK